MGSLVINSAKVAVYEGEEEGLLVFGNGVLVAVFVRLDAAFYRGDRGRWHLEVGFGRCAARPPTFADLHMALRWVAERLDLDPENAAAALAEHEADVPTNQRLGPLLDGSSPGSAGTRIDQ